MRLLLLTTFLLSCSLSLQAQIYCEDCAATFTDYGGVYLIVSEINVAIDGDPDLAEFPLDAVEVRLHHQFLSDVFIALESPAGDLYYLMADDNNRRGGCGAGPQGQMDFIFVRGNGIPISMGDRYVHNQGIFTLSCPYAGSPNFYDDLLGVTEAPNCDLDDYNYLGAPASGRWRLIIACVCGGQEIPGTGWLEEWGLVFAGDHNLIQYDEEAASLCNQQFVISTQAEAQVLACSDFQESTYARVNIPRIQMEPIGYFGLIMPYNPDWNEEACAVIKEDTIVDVVRGRRSYFEVNMASFPSGEYDLKRLVYDNGFSIDLPSLIGQSVTNLQANTPPDCLVWAEGSWQFEVAPRTPTTVRDTIAFCPGECVIYGAEQICEAGDYRLTIAPNTTNPCGQEVELKVLEEQLEPALSFAGTAVACTDDTLSLSASGADIYKWRQGGRVLSQTDELLITNMSELVAAGPVYVDFLTDTQCEDVKSLVLSDSCRSESLVLDVDQQTRICVERWAPQGVSWCNVESESFSYSIQENCLTISALSEGTAALCLYVWENEQLLKRELSLKATVVTTQDELTTGQTLVFPNPARHVFHYQQAEAQAVSLYLLNLKGQRVRSYQQYTLRAEHDLRGIAPGVYYVQSVGAQGSKVQRLVVL